MVMRGKGSNMSARFLSSISEKMELPFAKMEQTRDKKVRRKRTGVSFGYVNLRCLLGIQVTMLRRQVDIQMSN